MGQPQPVPVVHPPQTVSSPPAVAPRPRPRPRPRRRLVRRILNILLIGALAVAYICACVHSARLDRECRQARESCLRLETQIGELVVKDAGYIQPARIHAVADQKGYVPPAATDRVPVSPDLLVSSPDPTRKEAAPPRPELSAWARLGPTGR